jgi:hypothetical protein
MIQERRHLGLPQVSGMPVPVKPDEPPNPADIGTLGSRAKPALAGFMTHCLQE